MDLFDQERVYSTQGSDQLENQFVDLAVLLGLDQVANIFLKLREVEVRLDDKGCILDDCN